VYAYAEDNPVMYDDEDGLGKALLLVGDPKNAIKLDNGSTFKLVNSNRKSYEAAIAAGVRDYLLPTNDGVIVERFDTHTSASQVMGDLAFDDVDVTTIDEIAYAGHSAENSSALITGLDGPFKDHFVNVGQMASIVGAFGGRIEKADFIGCNTKSNGFMDGLYGKTGTRLLGFEGEAQIYIMVDYSNGQVVDASFAGHLVRLP
jgi:hypothetical protein